MFKVGNADASTWIWNVTDPINIKGVNGLILGDDYEFKIETDSLLEFVAFKGTNYPHLNLRVQLIIKTCMELNRQTMLL
ncbi:MAG: hypothetical protein R2764_20305 [Bacteroidales bacterium]